MAKSQPESGADEPDDIAQKTDGAGARIIAAGKVATADGFPAKGKEGRLPDDKTGFAPLSPFPLKGRKDRNAMLSPHLVDLLRQWWREGRRRGVTLPHGWLFSGHNGTDPISARQLHRVVQEAAERAEIHKQVSPHTLRHGY